MFDLKAIRDNPAAFDKNWARRGLAAQTPAILKLDEERRAVQTELQTLQSQRNDKSAKIGEIKKNKGDATALMNEVNALKSQMTELEERERTVAESLNQHLASLPNQLSDDVPEGADEKGNKEVRRHGEPKRINEARDHSDIGEALNMMDFETAAKISGSRFVFLYSGLARLERALVQFMLDTHTQEHGYTEVSSPLLVNDKTMFGTGQLPKFADDQFRTTRGDWLIPTSEVPLTNIVADMIVEDESLPRRYTSFTPCFRQEAGAAGKDTRGMIRMHQFYKVELVSITRPEDSVAEHERMTNCAETILKKLGLAYRTMVLCAGDTGFGSTKTYDIEVWLPGQNAYREISSCSNCKDFQARRMNARTRPKGTKDTRFVHTLNGSGVAAGRALIAILENYYDPSDGGVFIPDALKPYMGGVVKLQKSP
ncbi:MAG: serine--tRNA ligase [Alphaproteobacteria bacterium]|nr:serine--tRNA ligase [Alphaproteobacteria bacterium]